MYGNAKLLKSLGCFERSWEGEIEFKGISAIDGAFASKIFPSVHPFEHRSAHDVRRSRLSVAIMTGMFLYTGYSTMIKSDRTPVVKKVKK